MFQFDPFWIERALKKIVSHRQNFPIKVHINYLYFTKLILIKKGQSTISKNSTNKILTQNPNKNIEGHD